MGNKLNIKSSTIEKGLELAKEFLGKLISPTIEELGLFISDNIKYLRFKNQINILLKARKYVEEKKIKIKEIPIKILVPLLDQSSLEENEELQEKWARLLSNMVDEKTNAQNNIFPFLLGQLSIEEYTALKQLKKDEDELFQDYKKIHRSQGNDVTAANRAAEKEKEGFELKFINDFSIANIERLGLVKKIPPPIYIPEIKTSDTEGRSHEYLQIDAEYDLDYRGYRITELGNSLIDLCEE